ncbi:hypothetical protein [Novosphingobium fuchskuhlense]|uniref:hypothetical protein n=1 Tax=Novosphingobium fuchskuhlense TaxID=1117702 RepID=UPI0012E3B906|nr:hypothetical protein [Novosphingobium fuchskuhlense]
MAEPEPAMGLLVEPSTNLCSTDFTTEKEQVPICVGIPLVGNAAAGVDGTIAKAKIAAKKH